MPKLIQAKFVSERGTLILKTEGLDGVWYRRLSEMPRDFAKHFPFRFQEVDGEFKPQDIAQWCSSSARFISDRLKSLIEELEPGVHTFVPVEITLKDGTVRSDYSLLKIGRNLSSIIPERSEINSLTVPGKEPGSKHFVRYTYTMYSKLVFNRNVVGDSVLWQDQDLSGADIFCTDEFIKLLFDREISGFEYRANVFFDDEIVY